MHTGHTMETFDKCLKKIPKCSDLAHKKTKEAPKELTPFLNFVVSDTEKTKYDCIKKNGSKKTLYSAICSSAISHFEFHKDCNGNISKLCDWVKPGSNRIKNCLNVYTNKTTGACKKRLDANMPTIC